MKNILFLFLAVLTAATSVSGQTDSTTVITNLSADQFKKGIEHDKTAVIIDLRTDAEIEKGKIPGAVQIDYLGKSFDSQMSALDKNKTYYIYCQSGGRSADAAGYMEKQGFKKIIKLEKGYSDWKTKGFPVDKK
jgi:rhodanese-related sulfurtransferase